MLIAIKMVPINWVGWSANLPQMIPLLLPCFLLRSMAILLAEAKAISMPAKKQMSRIATKKIMSNTGMSIFKNKQKALICRFHRF